MAAASPTERRGRPWGRPWGQVGWEGRSEPWVTWPHHRGPRRSGRWDVAACPSPAEPGEVPPGLPAPGPAGLWPGRPPPPQSAVWLQPPDVPVLTAPAVTPTRFPQTGSSWLRASHPLARWKHQPDVRTEARGGREEVAVMGSLACGRGWQGRGLRWAGDTGRPGPRERRRPPHGLWSEGETEKGLEAPEGWPCSRSPHFCPAPPRFTVH